MKLPCNNRCREQPRQIGDLGKTGYSALLFLAFLLLLQNFRQQPVCLFEQADCPSHNKHARG